MATDVETLLVKLEGRITDFEKKMAQAERRAVTASSRIQGTFNKLPGVVNKAFGLLGVGLGASAFKALIVGSIRAGEAIGDLADKLGIPVKDLQELTFVAEQAGASQEDVANGFRGLTRFLAEASRGGKNAVAVLQQLGLSFDELRNKSPGDVFEILLDRIGKIENPLQRNAMLMAAFGKSGTALAQVAQLGAAGIDELRAKFESLGLRLADHTVRALQDAGDKLDILGRFSAVAGAKLTEAFLPALTDLTDFLTSAEFQGSLDAFLGEITKFVDTTIREAAGVLAFLEKVKEFAGNPAGVHIFTPAEKEALVAGENQTTAVRQGGADFAATFADSSTGAVTEANLRASDSFKKLTGAADEATASYGRVGAAAGGAGTANKALDDTLKRLIATANDDLDAALANTIERLDQLRSTANTGFSTFIHDLAEGKSAAESLSDAFGRMADSILDNVANLASSALFGKSGTADTGLFGTLLSSLFAGGGGAANGQLFASGGSVSANRPIVVGERGPEVFVPRTGGVIGTARGGGGGTQVALTTNIDARGADSSATAKINAALQARDQWWHDNLPAIIAKAETDRRL